MNHFICETSQIFKKTKEAYNEMATIEPLTKNAKNPHFSYLFKFNIMLAKDPPKFAASDDIFPSKRLLSKYGLTVCIQLA